MPDVFVQSFTHLNGMPKAERALPMLQRVATLVKPIMRKHGWVLPVLSEFFPESANLCANCTAEECTELMGFSDVNNGEKILLRLRLPWAPDTFFEEDQVVGVMLHELTHNVHGAHDEHFYKFLAGLEDEYDALQRSGYAGEGFFSPGHRLGAGVSHNLPEYLARAKAADAAEKRRKLQTVGRGGGRLGGRSNALSNLSPRELAARAAERRKRDELECGSGSVALREAAKAAKESVQSKAVDLTGDDVSAIRISPPGLPDSVPSSQALGRHPRTENRLHSGNSTPGVSIDKEWMCPVCTLINDSVTLQCGACLAERPNDTLSGWTCLMCGESGISHPILVSANFAEALNRRVI
ncbi:WLM domain-containing protein [Pisolithus marmoratus]|nr:WLM domain-containing protein [Pisolithus marmoratus]